MKEEQEEAKEDERITLDDDDDIVVDVDDTEGAITCTEPVTFRAGKELKRIEKEKRREKKSR